MSMNYLSSFMAGFAVVLMGTACNTASKPTVSGQHGGHDYVDLGLPSGNMWATCNIGAGLAEENGLYFAWGETTSKEVYDWSNYRWGNGEAESRIKVNKYCSAKHEGEVDNLLKLDFADDAANKSWGGKWRMPTKEEWEELFDACEWEYVKNYNGTGIDMKKGISKKNGNSIFFPFSGYHNGEAFIKDEGQFWSSTQYAKNGLQAMSVRMLTHGNSLKNIPRKQGLAVRAVVGQ